MNTFVATDSTHSGKMFMPLFRFAQAYLAPQPKASAAIQTDVASAKVFARTDTVRTPTIAQRMPVDSWDSHMHVTDPDYPLAKGAAYVPGLHNMTDVRNFEKTIGIRDTVFVQPSIYGTDNSCLLDALRVVGPSHGRGVIAINPDTVNITELQEWHKLGVRGVRLNLKSIDATYTEESLTTMLQKYADAIRSFQWVLELYIGMEAMPILEKIVPNLGVKISIAHFGAPTLPDPKDATYPLNPYQIPGFTSLVNLARAGSTWVKLSAAYRFDNDTQFRGVESIARELLKVAGDRCIFASDWPHTRFEGLDVKPFVETVLDWTDEVNLTREVFSLNAKELWDIDQRRDSQDPLKCD
jgi:predicted TIM-barrel fold metal-dependent hydrolase